MTGKIWGTNKVDPLLKIPAQSKDDIWYDIKSHVVSHEGKDKHEF